MSYYVVPQQKRDYTVHDCIGKYLSKTLHTPVCVCVCIFYIYVYFIHIYIYLSICTSPFSWRSQVFIFVPSHWL